MAYHPETLGQDPKDREGVGISHFAQLSRAGRGRSGAWRSLNSNTPGPKCPQCHQLGGKEKNQSLFPHPLNYLPFGIRSIIAIALPRVPESIFGSTLLGAEKPFNKSEKHILKREGGLPEKERHKKHPLPCSQPSQDNPQPASGGYLAGRLLRSSTIMLEAFPSPSVSVRPVRWLESPAAFPAATRAKRREVPRVGNRFDSLPILPAPCQLRRILRRGCGGWNRNYRPIHGLRNFLRVPRCPLSL